ncbi:MAG: TonB-dependent receptor plug domain-containing protein [Neptuniibacter sp.]
MQAFIKQGLFAVALLPMSVSQAIYAESENVMVISASRVEQPREATGNAITVLDSEYLENNQVRLVSDALRDVPGLAVNRQSGLGSKTQIRIRGAEANQTLVLIDGIEVNDIGAGSEFDFAHLMNLEIERVEVLRGAQSALWGSDAMGGVINIITKKGEGPVSGKLSVEAGSFGTHQESFALSGSTDQVHYALSGSFLDTDGISSLNENRGFTEEDGYRNHSYNFKGGVKATEQLSFDLVVRHLDADSDIDGFTFGIGPVDNDTTADTRQTFSKLSGQLDLLEGNWLHKLAYSNADTDYATFTGGAQTYTTKGEKKKVEYQTDYFINGEAVDQRVTFVAEHEKESFYSSSVWSTVNRDIDSTGVVLEYGLNFEDQYYVTIAGRRDYNDVFKDANTYSIAFSGWVTDALRVHASTASGVKNPTQFELFGSTETYTGNADLRPEKNKTWDLGAEYHFDSIDGYVDLTLFHSDVENLIAGAGTTSINLDSDSDIKGLELSAFFEPADNLTLSASYTYTDSDDGTGQELVRRAKHIASINSSYLFANAKTRLSGGLQYNGKQDDLEFDAFFTPNRVTLDSYTLANIALSHDISDTVRVFGRIENLLDEEYEEVVTYGTKDINAMVGIEIKGGL